MVLNKLAIVDRCHMDPHKIRMRWMGGQLYSVVQLTECVILQLSVIYMYMYITA